MFWISIHWLNTTLIKVNLDMSVFTDGGLIKLQGLRKVGPTSDIFQEYMFLYVIVRYAWSFLMQSLFSDYAEFCIVFFLPFINNIIWFTICLPSPRLKKKHIKNYIEVYRKISLRSFTYLIISQSCCSVNTESSIWSFGDRVCRIEGSWCL